MIDIYRLREEKKTFDYCSPIKMHQIHIRGTARCWSRAHSMATSTRTPWSRPDAARPLCRSRYHARSRSHNVPAWTWRRRCAWGCSRPSTWSRAVAWDDRERRERLRSPLVCCRTQPPGDVRCELRPLFLNRLIDLQLKCYALRNIIM